MHSRRTRDRRSPSARFLVGLAVATLVALAAPSPPPAGAAISSPTITSVSPGSLPQGSANQPVQLGGTGFQSGAKVTSHVGIHVVVTSFVSSSQLDLSVSVGAGVAVGSYNLILTNPDGGKYNCRGCFGVTASSTPGPMITSLNPSTVAAGSANQPVTAYGTNFASGAVVKSFAGIHVTAVFVSSSQLNLSVTVSSTVAAGSYNVVVTNPGGLKGNCKGCLTVASSSPPPTVSSVQPSAPAGSTTALVVGGTGFQAGLVVSSTASGATFGTPTSVTATSFDVSVSVPSATPGGTYDLTVTNPGGGTGTCSSCLVVTSSTVSADWPAYLFGAQHSSYNPAATSITPANVSGLEPVWRWLPPTGAGKNALFSSPVVVGGVVYVGSMNGYFYAVSEATRAVLWSRYLGVVVGTTCGKGRTGVVSTATVATDPATGRLAVYENAPDGHLYAMDAATGAVIWTGVVGIPSTTQNDYFAWGSPLVANNKVYVGIASQCDNPLVAGGVIAFNQDTSGTTNTAVATWYTLPAGQVGGSVWSTPALAQDGSIIATTGNGQGTINNPLYTVSIVRLDPNTLQLLDYFQVPAAEQTADTDFGGSPTMFTADLNGVTTPMVGACNKNGHYYALRQSDLSLVWDQVVTAPHQPGGAAQCDAAAIWDGTHLIEGGGAPTTINGTTYPGSVQSLNPATGQPIWQTGLPGNVVGSPTEDGAGVVAAPTYFSSTGQVGVYLLNAATGAILGFLPAPMSFLFGQPTFAGNALLVGAGTDLGLTAYQITTPGPPLTSASPNTVAPGTTATVTITGSGFTATPQVIATNTLIQVKSVSVTSPTTLSVTLAVYTTAPAGPVNLVVAEPGSPPTTDTCNNCLSIS
ncbi:MAG: outer membrane protein assembly factor BamB family protein [Acidimicrobiales bacterium]